MEIDYIPVGKYLLPTNKLSDPPDAPPLGYYGMQRKAHLREHRPINTAVYYCRKGSTL